MNSARHDEIVETKGDKRRRHLLEAAADCFRREGFHGASIARISHAAGMSAGHIYHYFPNKEAMIEAIVAQEESDLAELLRKVEQDEEGGDLATRLTRQTREIVEHNSDPAYAGLFLEIGAEAVRNPTVMQIIQRSDQIIGEQFFALIDRIGRLPPGLSDAELRLRMELVGALFNGILLRSLANPGLDQEAMIRLINEVIVHLLGDAQ